MTSTDAAGVRWSSSATYSARGRILDLGVTEPVSGSYRGVDAMGLLDTLAPSDSRPIPYAWSARQVFRVTVDGADGKALARGAFTRRLSPDVRSSDETVARDGFDGTMFTPPPGHANKAAVLVFGGSEGGDALTPLARALAAQGHPSLSIAYFHAPGLPRHLVKIPLEYFAHALRWLAHRPGIGRVVVLSASRGTEAAQLLALHYPRLVDGLALGSPSAVVNAGIAGGLGTSGRRADSSAWTYRGKQIPFDSLSSLPPEGDPSVIPVEHISAPILLVCGTDDYVWPSCAFSDAIIKRLDVNRVSYRHELLRYPDAGHFVGVFLPYRPDSGQLKGLTAGLHPWTNGQALEKVWLALLRFLR